MKCYGVITYRDTKLWTIKTEVFVENIQDDLLSKAWTITLKILHSLSVSQSITHSAASPTLKKG